MSHRALGDQFAVYQPPLPGMEAPAHPHKDAVKVPVSDIFPHPQIERHPGEYGITMHTTSRVTRVKTSALRPTQDVVDENTLHNPREGMPGVIKDKRGRYRIVDGHHRAAAALLRGDKHIDVELFHER